MHDLHLKVNGAELAELSAAITERGGSFSFQAHGSSMLPFIHDGDILAIEPANPNQLAVGDVVLYQSTPGRIIAHRIVRVLHQAGGRLLHVRGDAATGPAETVRSDQVLGRVVSARRGERLLHLDRPGQRRAALLWIKAAPLGPFLLRLMWQSKDVARQLLTSAQALEPYRRLAHALLSSRVRYRPARAGDLRALARFYRYTETPGVRDLLAELERPPARGGILLATIGGRLAGAISLHPCPEPDLLPDWCLQDLQVRSRYRRAGVGEQLVRLALTWAEGQGAPQVYLRVGEQNRAALALCTKMGFRPAPDPSPGQQTPAQGATTSEVLLVVTTG